MSELHGGDPETVRVAIESGEPLPGTAGFAGQIDGDLVRDVLGREVCFTEGDDHTLWRFDPEILTNPEPVPPGHRRTADGDERLWELPDPPAFDDDEKAISTVRVALDTTLEDISTEGLAVAFSGGIDSSILAARLDAPLYVAGFPDSHDVAAARSAAELLDRDLTVVEVTHEDIEAAVPEIVAATGRTNAMDIQIALPLYLVAQQVVADGYDRLAVGQGADELFGGYAKVAKAPTDPRVDAETIRGATREVIQSLPDQLERDLLTLRAAGVEPVAPLLHDRVVEPALWLPDHLLVTEPGEDGTRKYALREAAREWLPEEIVEREKKAVQYGSLVARELDRLARQAGFKRRMDDHVTQYVESLTE